MSWDQLLDLFKAASQEQRELAAMPPEACPNDGEPLRRDPAGNLRCVFDGWVWDGQPLSPPGV